MGFQIHSYRVQFQQESHQVGFAMSPGLISDQIPFPSSPRWHLIPPPTCPVSLARIPLTPMFPLSNSPSIDTPPVPWLKFSLAQAAFRTEPSSRLRSLFPYCNSSRVKSIFTALTTVQLWIFFVNSHGSSLLIPSVAESPGRQEVSHEVLDLPPINRLFDLK